MQMGFFRTSGEQGSTSGVRDAETLDSEPPTPVRGPLPRQSRQFSPKVRKNPISMLITKVYRLSSWRPPMANRLRVAEIHSILTLYKRGWSCRRIARELGVHRETVGNYVRRGWDPPRPDPATGRAAPTGDCEAAGAEPAKAPTGLGGPTASILEAGRPPSRLMMRDRSKQMTILRKNSRGGS